ncbi:MULTISPECIES: hypothetical protein [unclassified Mesorhizobium]|uniref:DUF6950 family protein n=1 Tax=unclassified Mesorhizobium TaxID=325217 RepID=UPI00095BDD34|nr:MULTISPECIES: hypothetical protein [unclassified Mesorhizobium]MBN9255279.1 hypothetical protein [Mesorhizobium sp.]OJX74207.1 MAG: hypothetical protein BGO93_16765 [Mesorhizobium sp. 65-26]
MNLETFIRLPRLWQWGGTPVTFDVDGVPTLFPGEDCTTFAASWVKAVCGVDPAADLRGAYDTAEGANAVVASAGGIASLVESRIEPLGWRRTEIVGDGAIGIVSAISGADQTLKEIPAIRFGPLWAVMGPRGAMAKKLDWTGVAWRLP